MAVKVIDIWEPRWHDKVVLLAKSKVTERNVIRFTKTPSMPGLWFVNGGVVKKCPLESNGKIPCYAIPLDLLIKAKGE